MNTETTIVEINGVKMEMDLRRATIVHQEIKVGSRVKLLEKSSYGTPSVHAGIVVGFDNFQTLPTITVAYIKTGYGSESPLKFAYINSKSTENWEMVPSQDEDLPVAKNIVLEQMDRSIETKRAEIETLERQRTYFL